MFLVGAQEPSDRARILAAALSCAPNAAASHLTAAWLWGLVARLAATIDLTLIDGRHAGRRPGVRLHRPRRLTPQAIRWRAGTPLTSPAGTLLDLAAVLDQDELEAAWALALSKRLTTQADMKAAVDASPPRPGIGHARQLADVRPELTLSGNERLMRRLVQRAELPRPKLNVNVCGKSFDLYWPEAKVAVEVDAFATHGAPAAFEDDRKVDADFKASGVEVLRFTGRRIRAHPDAVVARLAAVLALRLGGLPVARRR